MNKNEFLSLSSCLEQTGALQLDKLCFRQAAGLTMCRRQQVRVPQKQQDRLV